MTPVTPSLDGAFVAAFRSGTLTAAQLEAALPRDRPAVIFLLLQLSAAVADKSDPPAGTAHQPSGRSRNCSSRTEGFPTHVGVNRGARSSRSAPSRLPHARGGEPWGRADRSEEGRLPHARGDEGAKVRPAEFSTDDSELMVMHLRRGKTAPAAGDKALLGNWSGEPITSKDPEGRAREFTPRAVVLDGYRFVSVAAPSPHNHRSRWVGGKYAVDATKNPKWVDVESAAPFDDDKATRLYGSYEAADGRLKLALGTKRATRPLEFTGGGDAMVFDLKAAKDAPAEVQGVVEKAVREPVAKAKNVPAPMPKAIDKLGPNRP